MSNKPCLCRQYEEEVMNNGPGPECTVYLHRINGDKELTVRPKTSQKSHCMDCVVSWIKICNFTLDIALFSIFHMDIIKAIVKTQKRGVRCRILVYRHVMNMPGKEIKHQKYIKLLKKAGVQFRWICEIMVPIPANRLVLIDCTDPNTRPAKYNNERAFLYGDQTCYHKPNNISKDLNGLMVMKDPPVSAEDWCIQFEEMWSSVDFDSEFVGSESCGWDSHTGVGIAGPSTSTSQDQQAQGH